jgi:hypothetical protein
MTLVRLPAVVVVVASGPLGKRRYGDDTDEQGRERGTDREPADSHGTECTSHCCSSSVVGP